MQNFQHIMYCAPRLQQQPRRLRICREHLPGSEVGIRKACTLMMTRVNMIRRTAMRRATSCLILVLLTLMVLACQLGIRAQPAPAPPPPLPPPPPQPPAAGTVEHDSKVIDGYLYVRYFPPCAMMSAPAEWVAPIELTDLRSGSVIHLNGNGTLKESPKPDYKTEKGKTTLDAVLQDGDLVRQIVGRPTCPDKVYNPGVRQQYGWPDALAEDIGNPPMPKVGIGTSPPSIASPPPIVYPGWRGAHCWPMSGGNRECTDTATWKGFGEAGSLEVGLGTRVYLAIMGDEANSGVVRRARILPVQEKWSLRRLGNELHVGAEVHRAVATRGETLEKFVMPKLPAGIYILIADYESPLGEVEYGFKVELK